MTKPEAEKKNHPEISSVTEEVLQRTPAETILSVRPTAILLRDTLNILGRVDDSAKLSDLLFVAQECGVIEGDFKKSEVYNFSPFGPEPNRPVSGEFEYDLVLLNYYGIIGRLENGEIFWPLRKEGLSEEELGSEPMGVIKKPVFLKTIAQMATDRLRHLAELSMVKKNTENEEEFFERAKRSLYFISDDERLSLMIQLDAIVKLMGLEEANVQRSR